MPHAFPSPRCPPGLNLDYSSRPDSFGNILQNGSFNDTYTANNQHFGYAYDAAGNLLSDGLGDVYTWDAKGRLVAAGRGDVYLRRSGPAGQQERGWLGLDAGYGLLRRTTIARYAAGQGTGLIYG